MKNSLESDEDIFERVREDDEAALQRLLKKYQRPLGAFSNSLLRSRDLADEAVSNVFLNIWRRRATLAIKSTVRSYLFAAASNQSIKLLNERKQRATIGLTDVVARTLVDPRATDTDLLYRELHDEIERLLALLPPQRQLIFRMNRIEGLRYREIARKLKLSESTVQNHMVQANRQLLRERPNLRSVLARSAAEKRLKR